MHHEAESNDKLASEPPRGGGELAPFGPGLPGLLLASFAATTKRAISEAYSKIRC